VPQQSVLQVGAHDPPQPLPVLAVLHSSFLRLHSSEFSPLRRQVLAS
jgi:hypothetical protein